MDDASAQPTADVSTRLAALEQRCASMEAQMRTQKELVIHAFTRAIAALEAAPAFSSAIDESEPLTAVDNSPFSDANLKYAVGIKLANRAENLSCDTTPFKRDDDRHHHALKRRRTMADSHSLAREQSDTRARPRDQPVESSESGELDDEISLYPNEEHDHRKCQEPGRSGMSRRELQQLDIDSGTRGAAPNSSLQHSRPVVNSPGSTFVENTPKARDNSRAAGSKDHHRSRECRDRSSLRHSHRRHSHGHSKGRSHSRSRSRSRSRGRNKSQGKGRDRHQISDSWNSSSPKAKPHITGSNAEPVPSAGSRRGRHDADRSSLPYVPPALPKDLEEGPKQGTQSGAAPNKKLSSGRAEKPPASGWLELSPIEPSNSYANAWDAAGPPQVASRSGYRGWGVAAPSQEVSKSDYVGWNDVGPPAETPKPHANAWNADGPQRQASSSGYNGWGVVDSVQVEAGPTMPRSVNQLTASVEPISSHAKVAAWKGMDTAAKSAYASPHGSVDAVKAALSFCGSEDLGDRALASNLATPNRFCEDDSNDDDDDDDDDLGLLLVSKRRRSEMVLSILTDSGGHTLNSERMAPLWRIFAWIPLDTLPEVYRRVHGIDLWTPETKKQIRASIKDLPGLSERTSMNGLSRQTMIFRDKCHLKQARAFQRLFAFTPVFEPVLFFYLVTTVLRPLELSQAKTIARLWTEEFGRGLTYAVTKKLDKGGNNTKWESDEAVWSAAVDWLCRLARVTVEHGLDCLTSKTTNWDNPGPQSRKGSQAARNDPESELVAGLRRDELTELLKAAPTLLSKIIPSNLIGLLRSELNL